MSYCFWKRRIVLKIYRWYLRGLDIETICSELRMDQKDVNDIIDYMNEIYS
jgi:hypothetical protein